MTEEQIHRIAEVESAERTPLLLQDLLSTMVNGLIKLELFLVLPIAVFGVPRERLLYFPNEAYILTVTAILMFVGLLMTHAAGRSKALFAISVIIAPLSIVFSTSLEFFHVEIKRRLVRHYAKLQQNLPDLVKRLESAARDDRDRLLIRLMAFYGLNDEEIIGIGKLPGVRPSDHDSSRRMLSLRYVDVKSGAVNAIDLPLDEETNRLFVSCVARMEHDSRIFQFSKSALWLKVVLIARSAEIRNWSQITPFRVRGHFIIFAAKNLPLEIRERLLARKRF